MTSDRAVSAVEPSRPSSSERPPGAPERKGACVGEVVLYVLLATAACTVAASPALLGLLPEEAAGAVVPLAQLTPALVALGFYARLRPGRLRDVLALRWRGGAVGLGVVTVAGVAAVQLVLGLLVAGWSARPFAQVWPALLAVIPFFLLQSVFAIGEELGWRGWLATRTAHWPFAAAALASSLAWTLWHLPALPLVLAAGGSAAGVAYLVSIAAWAPFLLALRRASGSVWPAVAAHGALNSVRVLLTQSVADSHGVSWGVEIVGWVLWIAAAAALVRRDARRSRRHDFVQLGDASDRAGH